MMVCWCQWQKVYFTQLFLQNHKCFYNTQGLHSSLIFRSRTSAFLLFCCFLYLFMLSWWYVNFFWTLVSFSSVSVQPEFSDSLFFPSSVTSIRLNAAQWEEIVQDTTYFCKDLFHLRSRMEGIGIVSTSSLKSTLILVTRSMYKVFVFISENNKQVSLFGSGCLKLRKNTWILFKDVDNWLLNTWFVIWYKMLQQGKLITGQLIDVMHLLEPQLGSLKK